MTPITIKLQDPVQFGGDTISELKVDRILKVKDMKGVPIENLQVDHMSLVVARLTNQPTVVIEELSMGDFQKVAEVVQSFLSPGDGSRKDGKK